MPSMNSSPLHTRRRFLSLALYGAAAGSLLRPVHADQAVAAPSMLGPHMDAHGQAIPAVHVDHRTIELANIHTGEVLAVAYRTAAGVDEKALAQLQRLLRDHRNDQQHPMDSGLFDQLTEYALAAGAEPRFEVISGYRSPQTNAMLHERSAGVARGSLHMQGRAIDVRLRGVSCASLRDIALAKSRGGVGYYERSDFVHIDTGAVRTWNG
jgi:uncharacterized protein YcbK (DUF882 family)